MAVLAVGAFFLVFTERGGAQADYKRYYDEENLPKVQEIFRRGRYDVVIQVCNYALERGQPSWEWRTLRFRALAKLGRYEEARRAASETVEAFPGELGALLHAHELFTSTGHPGEADAIRGHINDAAAAVPQEERDGLDYVHLGEAALLLGADPSQVIEQYFGVAKNAEAKGRNVPPGLVEAHVASGELALEKDDFELAAKEFESALELRPGDPGILFGLAKAFLPSDRKAGLSYLERVLEEAPMHFGALLLQAEYAINYEQYDEAGKLLGLVESVNPKYPLAAAYRAVIAELERHDDEAFRDARARALSVWKNNPEVDYLIGRVLSRNYRHAEGAEAQQRALEMDPEFLPAKLQLALDYLRLGRLEDAWPLAEEVGRQDQYNVLAYNLEVLKKEIAGFASLETDDFVIRLPPEEAEIYGDRVIEILDEAKRVLGRKYGLEIGDKTLVEFYPNQQDFAIRSFGSLGGEGLLGVCFGSVVTMNSPGSVTAGRNNWEATLWHEYCHVVTLTATENKMPRWLSEGISVYEERQRRPEWGERMTPTYRRMILEDDALTPVSEMSQAFLQPESGEHLMFAYYQSMLVVEFLVDRYGMEALRKILADLAEGVLINETIARHTVPMPEFEKAFAEAARKRAESYGEGVDWSRPGPEDLDLRDPIAVEELLEKNPNNFWARRRHTAGLLERERWEEAVASAEHLIELLPEYTGSGNGYALKARAFQGMGDGAAEAEALDALAERSAEALDAYERLVEVDFERRQWRDVLVNADRGMAIDPFRQRIHYCRGCAHAALEENGPAVTSFEKALKLDPANPSEIRYRIARLLRPEDRDRARRHVLDALADSPRYREAHALLLDMEDDPLPEQPGKKSSEKPEGSKPAESQSPSGAPADEPAGQNGNEP